MNPELLSAAIGLIGALIGAGLSVWAQIWIARNKEKADRLKDAIARADAIRISSRLLHDAFHKIRIDLMNVESHRGKTEVVIELDRSAWEQHKEIFARELSFDQWLAVQRAVDRTTKVSTEILGAGHIGHIRGLVEAAMLVLENHCRDTKPQL